MQFGDILRNLLEETGMSQKELAEQLNIAASTLGNYVRNLREPDYKTLKQIAAVFQVSTDYLLDSHSNPTITPDEQRLLQIYRSLTAEQQELFFEQGKLFLRQNARRT